MSEAYEPTGNDIAEAAFEDFEAWRQARHPERYDYEALAEEYGMDCAAGGWQPRGVHRNEL